MANFDTDRILNRFKSLVSGTLMETLDIQFCQVGETFLTAKMPVSSKVMQPLGILHGGATIALIETVGSAASFMFIDGKTQVAKGLHIDVNHVRSADKGWVYARAEALHLGRTTHIWKVDVRDDDERLISTGKVTNIVLNR